MASGWPWELDSIVAPTAGTLMTASYEGLLTSALNGLQNTLFVTTSGTLSSGTYSATLSPSPPVGSYQAGMMITFIASAGNSGGVYLDVNSLGAVPIVKQGSTTLAAGDIVTGQVCVCVYDGTNFQLITTPSTSTAQTVLNSVAQGRLTLTSGTPVTTSDVSSASTLFYTPFRGHQIALFNSSTGWYYANFTELSLALSGLTANTVYDAYVWNDAGTLKLSLGTAWASTSARVSGGPGAITLQNGIWVNEYTDGSIPALEGRVVGTIVAISSSATADAAALRGVWNMSNRVSRSLLAFDVTPTWNYTTATWEEANGAATFGVSRAAAVFGLAEDVTEVTNHAAAANSSGSPTLVTVGIGIDTSTASSAVLATGATSLDGVVLPVSAYYRGVVAIGVHFFTRLEQSQASGTTTWIGSAGTTDGSFQTGLTGQVLA